jgi:hypothetical protein
MRTRAACTRALTAAAAAAQLQQCDLCLIAAKSDREALEFHQQGLFRLGHVAVTCRTLRALSSACVAAARAGVQASASNYGACLKPLTNQLESMLMIVNCFTSQLSLAYAGEAAASAW